MAKEITKTEERLERLRSEFYGLANEGSAPPAKSGKAKVSGYGPDTIIANVLEALRASEKPLSVQELADMGLGHRTVVNTCLLRLTKAGWAEKVSKGVYQHVERKGSDA